MNTRISTVAFLLGACGPSIAPSADAGPPPLDASAPVPIDWQPCPLEMARPLDSPRAECAVVQLPLLRDRADPTTIGVWVMRYRAADPERAQLWMLQGGPGASGASFGPMIARYAIDAPNTTFYTLDHRGVGDSTRLACPDQESPSSEGGALISSAEWSACIAHVQEEWGDGLAGFSSEGAARDVAELIERTRAPGVPVTVYGVSYGTIWGHRLMQLFPHGADGFVLDSVNWPDRSYDDYDSIWNEVGHGVMTACAADATCAAKLGPDPWQRLASVEDSLGAGHCPTLGADRATIAHILAWLIAYEELRPFAPALVYRLDRCDARDVNAISHLYQALFAGGDALGIATDARFSQVLAANITNSEMPIHDTPTDAELDRIASECLICVGTGAAARRQARPWPRYALAPELGQWAQTDAPALFLLGELDPFSPAFRLEEAGLAAHFAAPHQRVLVFTGATHGLIDYRQRQAPLDLTCGARTVLAFAADPSAPIDTSCVDAVPPPSFETASSAAIFGTADLWENP